MEPHMQQHRGFAIHIQPFASEELDEDSLDREPSHHAREHAEDNVTRRHLEMQLRIAEAEVSYLKARLAGDMDAAQKFNRMMGEHDAALTKLRGRKAGDEDYDE